MIGCLKKPFIIMAFGIMVVSLGGEFSKSTIAAAPQVTRGRRLDNRPLLNPPHALRPIDGVQEVSKGRFVITDPRALESAAELLQRKLGVPISYEDAPLVSEDDLVYSAGLPQNRRRAERATGWKGPLVPKNSQVTVTLPDGATVTSASYILQTTLNNYNSGSNSGRFKIVQFGQGEFSIVPKQAKNLTKQLVDVTSPLDLAISFPEEERTIEETLKAICAAINTTAGKILVARGPVFGIPASGYFGTVRVRAGSKNEIARDVLSRILRKPGGPEFSWRLDYMPDRQAYILSVYRVEVEVEVQGVGAQLVDLYWPGK